MTLFLTEVPATFLFIYFNFGLYYSGQKPLKDEFTPVQPNFKPEVCMKPLRVDISYTLWCVFILDRKYLLNRVNLLVFGFSISVCDCRFRLQHNIERLVA